MSLKGKLETVFELKATPEQYFNVWAKQAHQIPNHTPSNIQAVQVHEGDWETAGSIKIWNYTTPDGKAEILKEQVELDEENKKIVFVVLEGDMMKSYKVFKSSYSLAPKGQGCLATCVMEYEKLKERPHSTYLHGSHDCVSLALPLHQIKVILFIDTRKTTMSLKGKLETVLILKATPEQFFNVWAKQAHQIPNHTPSNIQAVQVHEDGKAEIFKEQVELDEVNKKIVLVGLEGDVMKSYKVFKPFFSYTKGPGLFGDLCY
ncbi:hypothetical protein GH714_006188 [Hevea brasiliensis]|uniref:Bet v I/Major latex protein domain-containing protein n=1 Tax=Hevea brasiliensis TaxID=3981 RepID=A0A6A6LX05_HEVBR|nr:hypothetical protein GH714_006188 [Hevea brasiliensis]